MSSNLEDKENCIKIAQILNIVRGGKHIQGPKILYIKKALQGFDINYKIKYNSLFYNKEQKFSNCTLLHLLVKLHPNYIQFYIDLFIEKGVDLLITDDNGYSALLSAFIRTGKVMMPLLLAQFKINDPTNFKCKNGISHFHVACTTDKIEIVDFFLKAGVTINEQVDSNSTLYPGYTALHFATKYDRFRTIELLLNHGASLHIKNANGTIPLHFFIEYLLKNKPIEKDSQLAQLLKTVYLKSLNLLDDVGLSRMHINCIFKKLTSLDQNIDTPVNFDSPFYPGYTCLHFASYFNSQIITFLLEKGADILAKDASSVTPLDMCLKKNNLDDIVAILSAEKKYKFNKLKLTDGSLLVDALSAMKQSKQLKKFVKHKVENINAQVPCESILWPGCTLLHLAVIFNSSTHTLLSRNADFTIRNSDGLSPLHLAFRMQKVTPIKTILKFHQKLPVNVVDCDNLSHLHIACAEENNEVVKLLLRNNLNVDLPTLKYIKERTITKGSTAFHMSVRNREIDYDVVNSLLSAGANLNAADEDGVTPFELILKHVSSFNEKNEKFQEFLQTILKNDVNSRITKRVGIYILRDTSSIKEQPTLHKQLISKLIEVKMHEKLGLTKLQVACAIGDFSMLKEELKAGSDLNLRIHHESPLWPGDTALHILFRGKKKIEKDIEELLYKYGADPTLKNANNLTAVLLSGDENLRTAIFLLKDKFTDVNPANKEGLSHFHLSCKVNDLVVVEQFLKNGVNVNTPVKFFAKSYPGYTPLHFAMKYDRKNLIELLFCYGAEFDIKAANGFTPLEFAENSKVYVESIVYESFFNIRREKILLDERLKDEIGLSFSENYFFSEKFVVHYKRMIITRRQAIRNLCYSSKLRNNFPKLHSLIILQCDKARERTRLLEPATIALRTFVNISLPELCCECIFKNLNNSDLKNLIISSNGKLELAPLPQNC